MKTRTICVLGGTGFVGRHLCNRLSAAGWRLRVPTRHLSRHRDLLVVPGVHLVEASVHDDATLRELLTGCAAAINLVGILNESRKGRDFTRVHVELPRRLAAACLETGVPRLLHMSALNANPAERHSQYLRTKGEGEDAVHAMASAALQVTSFQPAVIFGSDDSFFNRFAALLEMIPWVFPLACPDARMAPVYVGDVVEAFTRVLEDPGYAGRRCQLCGPREYRLEDLVRYTAEQLGLQREILGLPPLASRLQAQILEWVPGRPFSLDNFWSLQRPAVCDKNCLPQLGITPTAVESVVPFHLGHRGHRRRYDRYRRQARRGGAPSGQ